MISLSLVNSSRCSCLPHLVFIGLIWKWRYQFLYQFLFEYFRKCWTHLFNLPYWRIFKIRNINLQFRSLVEKRRRTQAIGKCYAFYANAKSRPIFFVAIQKGIFGWGVSLHPSICNIFSQKFLNCWYFNYETRLYIFYLEEVINFWFRWNKNRDTTLKIYITSQVLGPLTFVHLLWAVYQHNLYSSIRNKTFFRINKWKTIYNNMRQCVSYKTALCQVFTA